MGGRTSEGAGARTRCAVTRMDPRVLVVAPRLDLGGTEMHLLRVLPRLRAAGLDISLFTTEPGGRIEPDFKAAGVPVYGRAASGGRVLRGILVARALREVLRTCRPQIVHFFLVEPYLIGSLAACGLNGLKKVMSRRSLSYYQRQYPLLARTERTLHRSVSALIGNSTAVATELAEESGELRKVGLIHNGIEIPAQANRNTRDRYRREFRIPEDSFVLTVVANLIEYKGHADLISALASVRDRLGLNWRLLLVGRDEGIGPALRRQAESLGLTEHIVWVGEFGQPYEALAAADVGVLPSHEEGFSNSLLEKMANGLALVATRVGGNTDAVIDGQSGLLVPPRDPAALGAAIAKLYEDPALRTRLGAAARQRVEQRFSIEACTQRYLNLYRGLMRSQRPIAELIDPPDVKHFDDCDARAATSIPWR